MPEIYDSGYRFSGRTAEQLHRLWQEWMTMEQAARSPLDGLPQIRGPLPTPWRLFELYDDITPGGHAYAYPLKPDESGPDTSQPLFYVYDAPEGNIRARGSNFMTNSNGARGKARYNSGIGHWEIVSIQQQARRIKVTISTGCVSGGATFVPTALAVMDPGGQDPSNGGVSFPTITNYSTPIGNASSTTDGIKCEWDESLGVYLVYDAPCPVGC